MLNPFNKLVNLANDDRHARKKIIDFILSDIDNINEYIEKGKTKTIKLQTDQYKFIKQKTWFIKTVPCCFCDKNYDAGKMLFNRYSFWENDIHKGGLNLCEKNNCLEIILSTKKTIDNIIILNLGHNNSVLNCFPKDIINYISRILIYP
jgi:hypothetical protein